MAPLRLDRVLSSSPSNVTRLCDFAVSADSIGSVATTPLIADAGKHKVRERQSVRHASFRRSKNELIKHTDRQMFRHDRTEPLKDQSRPAVRRGIVSV